MSCRLWKVAEEKQLLFQGHSASIDSISMFNEERWITGSQDGSVSTWNIGKKKPTFTQAQAHGPSSPWITSVHALNYSDFAASGSHTGRINLWRLDSQKLARLGSVPVVGLSLLFSKRLLPLHMLTTSADWLCEWHRHLQVRRDHGGGGGTGTPAWSLVEGLVGAQQHSSGAVRPLRKYTCLAREATRASVTVVGESNLHLQWERTTAGGASKQEKKRRRGGTQTCWHLGQRLKVIPSISIRKIWEDQLKDGECCYHGSSLEQNLDSIASRFPAKEKAKRENRR